MPTPPASIANERLLIDPLFYHPSTRKSQHSVRSPWTPAKFGVTAALVNDLQKSPETTTQDERVYYLHELMPYAWIERHAKCERLEEARRQERIDEGYQASDELDEGDGHEEGVIGGAINFDDRIDQTNSYFSYEESMPTQENLHENEGLTAATSKGVPPSFPNMRSHFSDTSSSESSDVPAEEGINTTPVIPERIVRRRIRTGSAPRRPTSPLKRKRVIVITDDDSEAEEEKKRKREDKGTTTSALSSGSGEEAVEMASEKPKMKLPRKRVTAPRRVNKFMFW